MRIQTKLFLIILCSSALLVLGMYGLSQWTVDKRLLKYVNTREQQSNMQIIRQLAEGYQKHGSWAFLKENPRLIDWLARNSGSTRHPTPPPATRPRQAPHSRPGGPPPPMGEDAHRRPPPRNLSDSRPRPPPPEQEAPPAPRAPMAVLDIRKQPIVGRFDPDNEDTRLTPIRLADGDTLIGWFAFTPPDRLSEDFDLALSEELQTGFISISAIMLVLSAAIALPLSYLLLRRIKRLADATRQVAKGDFSQRVAVHSTDELGQLGRDFNELAQTLEANESARKRWLADISHELRTPLTVASGELEAMIDGVRPANDENLQSAYDEIKHLNHLIDDLYELSNADIGALKYQKTEVDLSELIEHEAHYFESLAAEQGLEMSLQLEAKALVLWADAHRLKQLIRNLLTNALKYTDAPGEIQVRLSSDDSSALITIADSAPGVEAQYLSRLFDPLFRVESSRNRKHGGSGLGLGISKQIVLAHGGSIQAEPSRLGGLAVHIQLPLAAI